MDAIMMMQVGGGHVMRSARAVMAIAVNVCAENDAKSDMI
jgi:hypothetical protein